MNNLADKAKAIFLDALESRAPEQWPAYLNEVCAGDEMLREVHARVSDGTGLAEAMAQHPRVFNELSVSMIRAGQEGGFLEDVLRRIANFTEHQEDLKAKVTGAMAYPVFLAVVGFLVLNLLVIFFVPRFKPIFAKLD